MGFRKNSKTYRLRFEGTDLDGLEVTVRSVSVGTIMDMAELADVETGRMKAADMRRMLSTFADALVSWNWEDDVTGAPVPATYEGVASRDPADVALLVKHWAQAVAGVPDPLGEPSTGGSPSEELSTLPTVPLSASRAS